MADTIVKINTWACPNCDYMQYNNPANEVEMNQIFFEDRYAGRPTQACPACYAGENAQHTKGIHYLESISGVDLSRLGQKQTASDATLEGIQVPDLDENGDTIQIQTGSRWELQVDQSTGAISSVEVPVYEPKMRNLTTQELADLKEQRDRSLDELEKVAV